MAGVQDQILRVCEAAHIPVVWATQVMESFVKDGRISRPEITDAAMSQRAECVMLNKGPYITEAVRLLSDVLQKWNLSSSKVIPIWMSCSYELRSVIQELGDKAWG